MLMAISSGVQHTLTLEVTYRLYFRVLAQSANTKQALLQVTSGKRASVRTIVREQYKWRSKISPRHNLVIFKEGSDSRQRSRSSRPLNKQRHFIGRRSYSCKVGFSVVLYATLAALASWPA